MSEATGRTEDTYTQAQHEKETTRIEIQCKRWFIAWLVTFAVLMAALIGTNLAWVIYENSFQDVIVEQDADSGQGGNAYIYGTGIGDINYGQGETGNQNPGETEQ